MSGGGWDGAMTLSVTTLSIMTFSVMGFFVTLSINDTQQNKKALYHYAECRVYCWAECHYAECNYAECRGADGTKNFFVTTKKKK